MKENIKFILWCIFASSIPYLVCSFLNWTFNFQNWSYYGRLIYILWTLYVIAHLKTWFDEL